jgi:hypothetical protein
MKCTLQIDVDIGSSSVARSIIGLVLGYVTSIVVDLAILIEVLPNISQYNKYNFKNIYFNCILVFTWTFMSTTMVLAQLQIRFFELC